MALKFEGMCRLCMKQQERMSHIFTEENGLWMKLSYILPKLEICAEDELPSQVCGECIQQIQATHHFLTQCEVSDFTFRKYIKKQVFNGIKELVPTADVKEEESDHELDINENHSKLRISSTDSENLMTWNVQETEYATSEESNDGFLEDNEIISDNSITSRIKHVHETKASKPDVKTHDEPQIVPLGTSQQADIDSVTTSEVITKNSSIQKAGNFQEPNVTTPKVTLDRVQNILSMQKPGKSQHANIDSIPPASILRDSPPLQNSLKPQAPNKGNRVLLSCGKERLSNSSISGSVTKRQLILQLKKSSLTSSICTVKFQKPNNAVGTATPSVKVLKQDINSLASNVSDVNKPIKLQDLGNGVKAISIATPVLVSPQDKDCSTSSSSATEKLKTYKYSRWKYFIPVELIKKNKILKLQKPMSENTCNDSSRLDGPVPGDNFNGSDGPVCGNDTSRLDGPLSGNNLNGSNEPVTNGTCSNSDRPVPGSKSSGLERADNEFICRIPQALERTCEECGREFPSEVMYRRHKLSHKMHQCSECGKVLQTLSKLKVHSRKHNEEKPVAALCDKCGICFAKCYTFKKHNRVHQGLKPFQCPECKQFFAAKHILESHARIHTGEKLFMCEQCGRAVRDIAALTRHRQTFHNEVRKSFKCALCPNNYLSRSSLRLHMVVHSGEKPYKCSDCGRCFSNRGLLKKHKALHTSDKTFSSSSSSKM